jgi:tRNA pseudouridine38-40 synthase
VTKLTQPAQGVQTWKLTLAYDGTDFYGWQVQPGKSTVQGELQNALERVTGEAPLPQGSGRTDAGVQFYVESAHSGRKPAARLEPDPACRDSGD